MKKRTKQRKQKYKQMQKVMLKDENLYLKTTNHTVKGNCSPATNDKTKQTCFTDPDLMLLKRLWNSKHVLRQIDTNNPTEIWKLLNFYLSKKCKKESCWLKQSFVDSNVRSNIANSSLAPFAPKEWKKNPNEWISSDEIIEVMTQYETKYKCFKFIGPTPIDFDKKLRHGECVWEEMCHFNLKNYMKKGKTKFGISINTDTYEGDGEHWVSLFINTKNKEIFYYDSAGMRIPSQVKRFVDRVIGQGKELGIEFTFGETYPVSHQYKNTECGVYSLFFLIHMLEDKITSDYLKTHVIKDEYIETFRKIYFNHD